MFWVDDDQVEQLHKIFKLCGTPSDDYWNTTKLPLAHMFKPQQSYESTMHERCRDFPKGAVALIERFLSFEPHVRGSASSALASKVRFNPNVSFVFHLPPPAIFKVWGYFGHITLLKKYSATQLKKEELCHLISKNKYSVTFLFMFARYTLQIA